MANERPIKWVIFCKRTNYPKLGYIIHKLNEKGIPCVMHGESWHAPILCVPAQFEESADEILTAQFGSRILDEVEDDYSAFIDYDHVKPNPLKGGN
jgi:hypothetical protein